MFLFAQFARFVEFAIKPALPYNPLIDRNR